MWRALPADETRDRLLVAALPHVPFDGWSDKTLAAAAAELGLEPEAARHAFPGGPVTLVTYHAAYADRHLDEALKETDLAAMRVRERIAHAVRLRLEQNAAHREAIRAALPILAQPANGPPALLSLYRTVDTIWFAVGDRTTDVGFYTKARPVRRRLPLHPALLAERRLSEGAGASWAFLDRRIADVMRIQDDTRASRPLPPARPGPAPAPAAQAAPRAAADPMHGRGPQS